MKREFSAGIVVYYKRKDILEYLLLHYQSGHWDLPKGHIDPGETKEQTALRELKEETGLEAVIHEGFEESFSYFLADYKTKEPVYKTVYFFIGKAKKKQIVLSHEHIGYMWLPFEEALEKLTYQNAKDLLKNVNKFLIKK